MKTEVEPKAKIKVMPGSAFKIETADYLPKLHQLMIFNGKRGSGKSVAATNLLRMYTETGTCDRILVVSPTFNSNKALMKDLDIKEEDVFTDPDDPSIIQQIVNIIDGERDEFLRYQHLVKNYKRIMKSINSGILTIDNDDLDQYLLAYYDVVNNKFNLPKPRYECYKQNRPPVIFLFVDDALCTKLMSNRKFFNLVTRHRHLGAFPQGGAVGLSILIAIQNYKAQSGGCNKIVRNNCTSGIFFKSRDESEVKQIADSFAGEIPVEKFIKLYEIATEEEHSFLFVDLHKKKNQPSMFRKRFDTYLIPDEISDEKISTET